MVDEPKIEELVERHRPALHSYVSYRMDRRLRQKEPVSDIVQSALREVLANPGRFTYQGQEAFRAFLIRAVEHKIANKRRYWDTQKRANGVEATGDLEGVQVPDHATPTPSEAAVERETLERFLAALDRLDEEDRKLLTMRRFAGLSTRAIAEELDLSQSTVRDRLGRIMTTLSLEFGRE